MSLEKIRNLLSTELTATDELIKQQLNSSIPLISELGQHIIDSGGKRLRPMLVLLGTKLFGYADDQAAIELAAVIELIHTATLLHDDVVDGSDMRRGRRTANTIWDNAISVLVGDFLYSRTFQMMVAVGSMPVMEVLASATNIMAEGEVLQLQNRNNPHTTEQQYMDVVSYKTGTLFKAAAQLGAVLCEQPPESIAAMGQYGLELGIAFQLVDDALDYGSSAVEIGKNIGDDLAEGKPTLPLIHVLQQGNAEQKRMITEAIIRGESSHFTEILQAITATDALDYTYQVARQRAANAIAALDYLPDSQYKEALIALAQFAVERRF